MLKVHTSADFKSAMPMVGNRSYFELNSLRDISGGQFPNGNIRYAWTNNPSQYTQLSESYIRIRCQLLNGAGTAPLATTNFIAPAMNLAPHLFKSADFLIGGNSVCRIGDYHPQVDTLLQRQNNSKAWMDGVGETLGFLNPDFVKRQSEITNDSFVDTQSTLFEASVTVTNNTITYNSATGLLTVGTASVYIIPGSYITPVVVTGITTLSGLSNYPAQVLSYNNVNSTSYFTTIGSWNFGAPGNYAITTYIVTNLLPNRNVPTGYQATTINNVAPAIQPGINNQSSTFEIIWRPQLSVWKSTLPCGNFELILTPENSNSYQSFAVESLGRNVVAGVDFQFNIIDMFLYLAQYTGPEFVSGNYFLDLTNVRCQTVPLTTNALQEKTFDVANSTRQITIAFQDSRYLNDTRFLGTKFRSYDYNAAAGGSLMLPQELTLNRLHINYAGSTKPSPDRTTGLTSSGTNGVLLQDYTIQAYMENLLDSGSFFDDGSAESLSDWKKRGAFYSYLWPRSGLDIATRATIYFQMPSADITYMNLLIFDHSQSVAGISIANGRVVNVEVTYT